MDSQLMPQISTEFIKHIHQLFRECRRYVSGDDGDEETLCLLAKNQQESLAVYDSLEQSPPPDDHNWSSRKIWVNVIQSDLNDTSCPDRD